MPGQRVVQHVDTAAVAAGVVGAAVAQAEGLAQAEPVPAVAPLVGQRGLVGGHQRASVRHPGVDRRALGVRQADRVGQHQDAVAGQALRGQAVVEQHVERDVAALQHLGHARPLLPVAVGALALLSQLAQRRRHDRPLRERRELRVGVQRLPEPLDQVAADRRVRGVVEVAGLLRQVQRALPEAVAAHEGAAAGELPEHEALLLGVVVVDRALHVHAVGQRAQRHPRHVGGLLVGRPADRADRLRRVAPDLAVASGAGDLGGQVRPEQRVLGLDEELRAAGDRRQLVGGGPGDARPRVAVEPHGLYVANRAHARRDPVLVLAQVPVAPAYPAFEVQAGEVDPPRQLGAGLRAEPFRAPAAGAAGRKGRSAARAVVAVVEPHAVDVEAADVVLQVVDQEVPERRVVAHKRGVGPDGAAVGQVADAPLRVQHADGLPEIHVEGADRQDAVRVRAAQEPLGQVGRRGVEGQRRLEGVGVPGVQAVGGVPADAAGLRVPHLHAQVGDPVDEVLDLHAGERAPVAGAEGAQDHQVELRAVDAQVERHARQFGVGRHRDAREGCAGSIGHQHRRAAIR